MTTFACPSPSISTFGVFKSRWMMGGALVWRKSIPLAISMASWITRGHVSSAMLRASPARAFFSRSDKDPSAQYSARGMEEYNSAVVGCFQLAPIGKAHP